MPFKKNGERGIAMLDKWSVELTDEEWGIACGVLAFYKQHDAEKCKQIAEKIYETRKEILKAEKEKLICKIAKGYGV